MTSVRARVLRVLALVAFVAGLLLFGANMTLPSLLLETQLTYVVYGIAGGGVAGSLAALFALDESGARAPSRIALIALVLNAALIAGTVYATTVAVALPTSSFTMAVGDTLPEFDVEPRDPSGKAVRLADLRGRPAVLLFHRGGWCPFCQAELAGLGEHEDEITALASVLAISVDVPAAVRAFARARNLEFTLLHDDGAHVTRQYGLTYEHPHHGEVPIPATIVLDKNGRIAWFHIATTVRDRPDPEELLRVLRRLT